MLKKVSTQNNTTRTHLWLYFFITGFILPLYALCFQQPDRFSTSYISSLEEYEEAISRYRYYKPDSAVYFARRAIALARANNDLNSVANMINQLGMVDDNFGKFEDSRLKYLNALAIYSYTSENEGMAKVTIRLGVVELRKGNYDKATKYFLDALKLSDSTGNKYGVMEANLTLAEAYIGQKHYHTAFKYLVVAEKINKQLPFSSLSLNIVNNFGIIYRETNKFEKAIAYLERGISESNTPKYQGLYITLMNTLASVYARQGLVDESIRLQVKALEKAREIKNYLRELQTLTGLAGSYARKDPAIAITYLQQALALAKEKRAKKQEMEVSHQIGDIYKSQGKYELALKMKENEQAIADSFFYKEMSLRMANLQSVYELDKSKAKVQELSYINSKQSLKSRIILGVSGGILLVLMVMLFFYFRTKKLNTLLNKANSELTESNGIKDKLFSVLGHDLRTPFVSVTNMLDLINENNLTEEERQEITAKLAVSCNASLETLNKLLKWGEMQIKGIRQNQIELSADEAIGRNIELLAEAAEEKSIQVQNLANEGVNVISDPDHLDFILRNLLSNAIKFTPNGGKVTVVSSVQSSGEEVLFSVKDNGIGIPADRLKGIFKINNKSTRGTNNEKGTSIGLIMCKEFIEANNGTIQVSSSPGAGSDFTFSLKRSGSMPDAGQRRTTQPVS